MMNLFAMTEAQLGRSVESHFDRMLDDFVGVNEPERLCENCRYYDKESMICQLAENALS